MPFLIALAWLTAIGTVLCVAWIAWLAWYIGGDEAEEE